MGKSAGSAPGRSHAGGRLRRRFLALPVAGLLLLAGPLAGCGLLAEPPVSAATPVATTATADAASPPMSGQSTGTQQASSPVPSPSPTSGKGPRCPVLRCTSVLVTGEILVGSRLGEQAQRDAAAAGKPGMDFLPLLEGQRRYLSRSDLAVCHLGAPLAKPDGPFGAGPWASMPPQIITAAKEAGYQACSTAGTHAVDHGSDGLLRTLDALDAAGLKHTGTYRTANESQQVLILQSAAAKIAVVEATQALNGQAPDYPWQVDMLDPAAMIAKARKARDQGADVVIAAIQAGNDYAGAPSAQRKDVAHALADSGQFNLIYGHTRSVLPIEHYKGTWIAYGLGSGIADPSEQKAVNNEGMLLRVQFGQAAGGTWTLTDLAWAPSVMMSNPYRWCSVAADVPQGPCAGAEADAATRERSIPVLESMGAAAAGAHELLITLEP